jgi:hypothetical protein
VFFARDRGPSFFFAAFCLRGVTTRSAEGEAELAPPDFFSAFGLWPFLYSRTAPSLSASPQPHLQSFFSITFSFVFSCFGSLAFAVRMCRDGDVCRLRALGDALPRGTQLAVLAERAILAALDRAARRAARLQAALAPIRPHVFDGQH